MAADAAGEFSEFAGSEVIEGFFGALGAEFGKDSGEF